MGVQGEELIACWGGFGFHVSRGEQRVSEMERHAMHLRERVNRLQSMLPGGMMEATAAIQKGEEFSDLRPNDGPEDLVNSGSKVENKETFRKLCESCKDTDNNEIIRAKVDCTLSESDDQRLCTLQILARKEKELRKQIYNMECKEEFYLKALCEVDKNVDSAINDEKETTDCKDEGPDRKNSVMRVVRETSWKRGDLREKIANLEVYSKKLCVNLKNLQKDRVELSREADVLSRELDDTKNGLGETVEKVFHVHPSERDTQTFGKVLKTERNPCSSCGGKKLQDSKSFHPAPDDVRVPAGQFKETRQMVEERGLHCNVPEPIRNVADKLKALDNKDDECPCGEPAKCDSCIICSCSEWERELEGGGDDEPEVHPCQLSFNKTETPAPAERCRCGCYETSSESECPCGCCDDNIQMPICRCNYNEKSDFIETSSNPSTITTTTIPSSIDDVSSSECEDGKEIEYCRLCNTDRPCHDRCELCQCESTQKLNDALSKNQICEMCIRCKTDGQSKNEELCDQCELNCTTRVSHQEISACSMCQSSLQRRFLSEELCQISSNNVTMKDKIDAFNCVCSNVPNVPTEAQKVCRVDKLKERFDNPKNQNHILEKLPKNCSGSYDFDVSSLASDSFEDESCRCPTLQNPVRQTTSGLIKTIRLLQTKCRTKDSMIVVLADELKHAANPGKTNQIFESLTDPELSCRTNDFDYSELWKYLNLPVQNSYHGQVNDGNNMCKRYLFIGLLVLLISLLYIIRSYVDLSSVTISKDSNKIFLYLSQSFVFIFNAFEFLCTYVLQFLTISSRKLIDFLSHVGLISVFFGLSSLLTSGWSFIERIFSYCYDSLLHSFSHPFLDQCLCSIVNLFKFIGYSISIIMKGI